MAKSKVKVTHCAVLARSPAVHQSTYAATAVSSQPIRATHWFATLGFFYVRLNQNQTHIAI